MRPAAWRVGLFALLGLALLVAATVLVSGGWLAARERAVLRFDSSVFGLQTGAPVVFRGVRVGQVTGIGFEPGPPGVGGGLAVPVTVEFDRELLLSLAAASGVSAAASTGGDHAAVKALVARGLAARLALQSLLTGQLYVDLDFGAPPPAVSASAGLPLIPTQATRLQTLQAQLQDLDLAALGRDIAEGSAALRRLLAGPEPARALARGADAAQALERLALRLEKEVGPLARSAQGGLAEGRQALQELGAGARQFGQAAHQVAAAASQVQGLARAGTPALAEVQQAAAELARAAASLRAAAGEGSALQGQAEAALQDLSRAARALRELSDTLERRPDALLRGRAAAP